MDKENLIKITNKLYKLTLLFPQKEPLKYKIREIADDILADSVSNPKKGKEILKDIEILNNFFEVAKFQNWVKIKDILEIQEEYGRIKDSLKTEIEKPKIIHLPQAMPRAREFMSSPRVETQMASNSNRKQKIIEILKEKDKIQVWEVKKIFPEVTKRTLRRDFENLLRQGLIERIGERNNTYYRLIT
jgi:hypothetical protein